MEIKKPVGNKKIAEKTAEPINGTAVKINRVGRHDTQASHPVFFWRATALAVFLPQWFFTPALFLNPAVFKKDHLIFKARG